MILNPFLIVLALIVHRSQTVQINYVGSAFLRSKIVPDIIDKAPTHSLLVSYPVEIVDLGEVLSPKDTKQEPYVYWSVKDKLQYYTLLMVDRDAPSRKVPILGEINHWLVGNIVGNNVTTGDVIAEYSGPTPPIGTGLHRYAVLVFKQTGKLDFAKEKRIDANNGFDRMKFNTRSFMKKYQLLEPVAGTYFEAEFDKEMIPFLDMISEIGK